MAITLTNSQLSDLANKQFEVRLIDILTQDDTAAASYFSTKEGAQALREQCVKARSYDLVSELDIGRYVITAWLLGPDFDECFPAMSEYLQTTRLTPSEKAEAIEHIATAVLTELQQGKR